MPLPSSLLDIFRKPLFWMFLLTCSTQTISQTELFVKLKRVLSGEKHLTRRKEFYKREVMSSKNLNARDGSQHMLRYLRGIVSGRVIAIDMPFGGGSAFPEREFDVRFREGEPVLYIEFKSIDKDSDIEIEQLLSYLSLVNNLTNLRYVFNAKKLNTQQAREMMQKVFRANAQTIFNALSSTGKFQQLFQVQTIQQFLSRINNINDTIYNLVTIN
jgi:hypothetical protein